MKREKFERRLDPEKEATVYNQANILRRCYLEHLTVSKETELLP